VAASSLRSTRRAGIGQASPAPRRR
jgi:hypothetical protein